MFLEALQKFDPDILYFLGFNLFYSIQNVFYSFFDSLVIAVAACWSFP